MKIRHLNRQSRFHIKYGYENIGRHRLHLVFYMGALVLLGLWFLLLPLVNMPMPTATPCTCIDNLVVAGAYAHTAPHRQYR